MLLSPPVMYKLLTVLVLVGLIGNGLATVNLCSNVVDNLFIPHVTNCSEYYLCIGKYIPSKRDPQNIFALVLWLIFLFFKILANQSIVRSCTPGYYFDARDQQCVDVSEVRCLPKCPATGLSSFCYDRTCTKYVLCFAGEPVVRECVDGLQYNAETDRCDYPQYVDCVDNLCVRQNNPDNIVFIASKSVCDKYYICVDGQPTNQTCSSGLQFNKETNSCDFPSRTNCEVSLYNESRSNNSQWCHI